MVEMTKPRLVHNHPRADHLKAIKHVTKSATKVSMAVAFLKTKGLEKIIERLRSSLKSGASIEIFVGRDFCLTEPRPLDDLLRLCKRYPLLEVFLAKPEARSTFHPKLYLGVGTQGSRLLVGSANLTGGAMATNEEISLLLTLGEGDALLEQVHDIFAAYRTSDRFEVLDEIVLEQYRSKFKLAQDTRRRIEKEIASADTEAFDLALLTSLHDEWRGVQSEMTALAKRRDDRKSAKTVQRRIAKLHSLSKLNRDDRENFERLFRDLVTSGDGHRHLWHSGDIHRRGQAALRQPQETIALFEAARVAAKLLPEVGYASLRAPADEIDGVGINMVSEILCTFAPKRYAVFNGNTAAALRLIRAEPPKSVTLFSPNTYARVCGIVDAVRRRIGGNDLSDADAFLNWIYQQKVKGLLAKSEQNGA